MHLKSSDSAVGGFFLYYYSITYGILASALLVIRWSVSYSIPEKAIK